MFRDMRILRVTNCRPGLNQTGRLAVLLLGDGSGGLRCPPDCWQELLLVLVAASVSLAVGRAVTAIGGICAECQA